MYIRCVEVDVRRIIVVYNGIWVYIRYIKIYVGVYKVFIAEHEGVYSGY